MRYIKFAVALRVQQIKMFNFTPATFLTTPTQETEKTANYIWNDNLLIFKSLHILYAAEACTEKHLTTHFWKSAYLHWERYILYRY